MPQMASLCIYKCYRSGIGKRTGFQETDQKMATTSAVKIEFSFEETITAKQLAAIEKKVATLRNHLEIDSTVTFFTSYGSIEVILTFDANYSRRDAMQLHTLLNRLINSHKQSAMYGWSYPSELVGA